jgi:hypothetical protein
MLVTILVGVIVAMVFFFIGFVTGINLVTGIIDTDDDDSKS